MSATHSVLIYHIVFSTKSRQPWLTPEVRERLFSYMAVTATNLKGTKLLINGVEDHVHILVTLPPNRDVAKFVQQIKANTSRWFHDTYKRRAFAWQEGYGAFSVSVSQAPRVRKYIRDQEEHHKSVKFKNEYLVLLQKHEVEFEIETVFD